MAAIATTFGSNPLLAGDRPIMDKTGLSEKYDFVFEFTPELNAPLPPNVNFQPDPTGPTFLQALKEQLGLKLEPGTGAVEVIVVDHVEQPSEN
jgi:bla regulator protein blaR1